MKHVICYVSRACCNNLAYVNNKPCPMDRVYYLHKLTVISKKGIIIASRYFFHIEVLYINTQSA